MKKFLRISVILVMLVTIFTSIYSFAANSFIDSGIINNSEGWTGSNTKAEESAKSIMEMSITIIKVVAVAVAVVMLLAVAIKYMTAAPDEKANIKKSSFQYVVGAVIIFAATGILSIISSFADNVKSSN